MRKKNLIQLTIIALILLGLSLIVYKYHLHRHHFWSVHHFSTSQSLADYLRSFGAKTVFISILIMVLQTLFTPLPLFLVAGANGFIFGILEGIFITLVGAMIGATIAFYLARLFGRELVSRWIKKPHLSKVDSMSTSNGIKMVFLARLVPVIPSSLVSYLAGLSKISFKGFFVASIFGKMPEIIIYTALGHSLGRARGLATKITVILIILTIIFVTLFSKKKSSFCSNEEEIDESDDKKDNK